MIIGELGIVHRQIKRGPSRIVLLVERTEKSVALLVLIHLGGGRIPIQAFSGGNPGDFPFP